MRNEGTEAGNDYLVPDLDSLAYRFFELPNDLHDRALRETGLEGQFLDEFAECHGYLAEAQVSATPALTGVAT